MNKPLITALIITVLAISAALFFTMVQGRENAAQDTEQKSTTQPQHSIPEGSPVVTPKPNGIISADKIVPAGIVAGDDVATSASGNIMVSAPKARATIGNSVTISGNARVFENTLNYRVLDGKGVVLAEGTTIANAPDVGQFGAFSVTPTWNTPKTITGTIEVFDYSAKDGSVIDLVTIPVGFAL